MTRLYIRIENEIKRLRGLI